MRMPTDIDIAAFSDLWWEALAERCARDEEYGALSLHTDLRIGVRVDGEEVLVHLGSGGMSWRRRAAGLGPSWDVALSGPAAAWEGFLASVPPPGHQDLFSLLATVEGFEILGDPLPLLQHVRATQRWLRLFREVA